MAIDPQGNIAWISTTGGGGGGFGGDVGVTAQFGYLQDTSVFKIESGSVPTFNIAAGDGVQGAVGVDLAGNVNLNVGFGEGFSTLSTVDVSSVKVLACGPQ